MLVDDLAAAFAETEALDLRVDSINVSSKAMDGIKAGEVETYKGGEMLWGAKVTADDSIEDRHAEVTDSEGVVRYFCPDPDRCMAPICSAKKVLEE